MTHQLGLSLGSRRRVAAAVLAAAAAVLALAAFAPAALAAPAVTLTHDPDLRANPIVTVEGTGFTSPTPPPVGLYASQIAIREDGSIAANSAKAKYIRAGGPTPDTVLNPDGSFSTEVEVVETFGSGDDAGNCAVDVCAIATWLAHTNPTLATLYTSNAIYYSPTLVVDPDWGIDESGQTLSVKGGGIPASYVNGKGIIVSQMAVVGGAIKTPGAGSTGVSRYIRAAGTGANKLNADGTFDSDLTLSSTFTDSSSATIDCMEVQCEVAIWEGQSFPSGEGSLLARVPIEFGRGIGVTPANGLSVLGQDVSVEGAFFDPGDFPSGVKVSLGLIDGSDVWLNDAVDVTPQVDGSFEAEVPVAGLFIKPGQNRSSASAGVDCIVLQCSILVWDGETDEPTPSDVIASKPVSFQRPSIVATPAAGLDQGQTVSVSGSGFSPAGTGSYVSEVALIGGEVVTPPPISPDIMQWIRAAALGGSGITLLDEDGTFETPIVVSRTFKAADGSTIDCMVEQCEIIAWRGHTMPTPESIYASAPLAFDSPPVEKPDEVPPVDPTPPATKPVRPNVTVKEQKQFKLGTTARKLDFVTVRCGSAACHFQKPQRVAVKIGKRKLWLAVTGPKHAAAGKVATFGVRVNAGVAKQLAGHKVRVKFKVQARSDSGKRTINVDKLLVGAPR